jgi:cytochrome c oxidase subunit III
MSAAHRRAEGNAVVGMAIFLGATAVLFAALLFAYGIVRVQARSWPPPGVPPLPRGLLAGSTLVLALASAALRRSAGAALALGGIFLALQALAWRVAVADGLGPASGPYASIFFAVSGLHAAHVLGGLVALAVVAARRRRGPAGARGAGRGLVTIYWDFMLAVWVVLFLAVCVA